MQVGFFFYTTPSNPAILSRSGRCDKSSFRTVMINPSNTSHGGLYPPAECHLGSARTTFTTRTGATPLAIPTTFTKGQRRALYARYCTMRNRHRKHGFGDDSFMSWERFCEVAFSDCVYCGAPPSCTVKPRNDDGEPLHISSIDRIDSDRGYEDNNIVPACRYCNNAKWRMSASEFFEHVVRIYNHSHLERRAADA